LGPVFVPQSAQPPEEIPALPQLAPPQTHPNYAGFWLRAAAYLLDTIFISLVLAMAASFHPSAFIIFPDPSATSPLALPQMTRLAIGLAIPIVWFYYAFFESSSWQATPGKRILRLYVTDMNGRPITFARATMRHFAKVISGLTFLVGYFLAGFTEKKQALHDLLASCLVLRRP
jgi:uncharacterized RDD family membrane protein YckC